MTRIVDIEIKQNLWGKNFTERIKATTFLKDILIIEAWKPQSNFKEKDNPSTIKDKFLSICFCQFMTHPFLHQH